MNPIEQFEKEKAKNIEEQGKDYTVKKLALDFMVNTTKYKYSYNYTWMGRPIIQYPEDMIAMQEIIYEVKPDLIIETGIAHGGSIVYYASLLELIGKGEVLGIDIDIRAHNKEKIEAHPMYKRISMIEGSSISREVINEVKEFIRSKDKILVCLDSNHTHDHVLKELQIYSRFVTKGSYLVVFDTVIEDVPNEFIQNRPWDKDNNPKTAVKEFLKTNDNFSIDKSIQNKIVITVAPDGYLRRIK